MDPVNETTMKIIMKYNSKISEARLNQLNKISMSDLELIYVQ